VSADRTLRGDGLWQVTLTAGRSRPRRRIRLVPAARARAGPGSPSR